MPDPTDRGAIERALADAQRAARLHDAADRAGRAYQDAYARLFADPADGRARFEAMAGSDVGPDVAADVLRRIPQAFGPLRPEAARLLAGGWGRDLTDAVPQAGRRWREAEAQRPGQPAAQVTAEVTRLDGLMRPFLERDRAKEIAERALKLGRTLDRGDRDRGGWSR